MSRPPTDKKNGPMRTVALRLSEEDIATIKAAGIGSFTAGVRALAALYRRSPKR